MSLQKADKFHKVSLHPFNIFVRSNTNYRYIDFMLRQMKLLVQNKVLDSQKVLNDKLQNIITVFT